MLAGASFEGSILTGAEFENSDNFENGVIVPGSLDLTGADFTNATINSARMDLMSADQLYSTASYQEGRLRAVRLFSPLVTPGEAFDFVDQDLENAELFGFDGEFQGADFSRARLIRTRLSGDFSEATWVDADMRYSRLPGEFPSANFDGQDLRYALLGGKFPKADFSNADLRNAAFFGEFDQTVFDNARIDNAELRNGFAEQQFYATANYRSGDLRGIEFDRTPIGFFSNVPFDLSNWELSSQDLSDARFNQALLNGTDLVGARLTRAELGGTQILATDFSQANLAFAQLSSGEFNRVMLSPNTVIEAGDFSEASLTRSNLFNAEISGSVFVDANLAGANLRRASIRDTDFSNANLQFASLELANLVNVTFNELTEYNEWTVFPAGFDPEQAGLKRIDSLPGDFSADGRLDALDIDILATRLRQRPSRLDVTQLNERTWLITESGGKETRLTFSETERPSVTTVGNRTTRVFESRELLLTYTDLLRLNADQPDRWLEPALDLTGDNTVNQADMERLLELANTTLGDANLDGIVGFADFLALSGSYQAPGGWADGDFNGDGRVSFVDFTTLSGSFGRGASTSDGDVPLGIRSVPEPKSPLIAWVLLIAAASRRKASRRKGTTAMTTTHFSCQPADRVYETR